MPAFVMLSLFDRVIFLMQLFWCVYLCIMHEILQFIDSSNCIVKKKITSTFLKATGLIIIRNLCMP